MRPTEFPWKQRRWNRPSKCPRSRKDWSTRYDIPRPTDPLAFLVFTLFMTASDHAPITSRSAFHRELQLWGPERTQTTDAKIPSLAEAQHYCRQLAQSHYENFSVVSWFVPPSLRQDLYTIYAYCRWSDDLADELDSPSTSTRLLEWWKQELRSCGSGEPMHPVMVSSRYSATTSTRASSL